MLFAEEASTVASPTTLLGVVIAMSMAISGLLGLVIKFILGLVTDLTIKLHAKEESHSLTIAKLVEGRDILIREIREQTSKEIKEARVDYKVSLDAAITKFDGAITKVVEHCEREGAKRDAAIRDRDDKIDESFSDVRKGLEEFREAYLTSVRTSQKP